MNMITQRSIEEGVAMEKGKTTPEYFEACSIIEMHDDDVKALGLVPNQLVRVTSECGSVVVKVVKGGRQSLYPALHSSRRVSGQTRWCPPGPRRPGGNHSTAVFP